MDAVIGRFADSDAHTRVLVVSHGFELIPTAMRLFDRLVGPWALVTDMGTKYAEYRKSEEELQGKEPGKTVSYVCENPQYHITRLLSEDNDDSTLCIYDHGEDILSNNLLKFAVEINPSRVIILLRLVYNVKDIISFCDAARKSTAETSFLIEVVSKSLIHDINETIKHRTTLTPKNIVPPIEKKVLADLLNDSISHIRSCNDTGSVINQLEYVVSRVANLDTLQLFSFINQEFKQRSAWTALRNMNLVYKLSLRLLNIIDPLYKELVAVDPDVVISSGAVTIPITPYLDMISKYVSAETFASYQDLSRKLDSYDVIDSSEVSILDVLLKKKLPEKIVLVSPSLHQIRVVQRAAHAYGKGIVNMIVLGADLHRLTRLAKFESEFLSYKHRPVVRNCQDDIDVLHKLDSDIRKLKYLKENPQWGASYFISSNAHGSDARGVQALQDCGFDLDRSLSMQLRDRRLIYVDTRELRSELPRVLRHENIGIKVTLLSSADYVIASSIGVERKSISDLLSSISHYRLYSQLELLSQSYQRPVLLIELCNKKTKNYICRSLPAFKQKFPRLSVLWANDSYHSARLFSMITQSMRYAENHVDTVYNCFNTTSLSILNHVSKNLNHDINKFSCLSEFARLEGYNFILDHKL